MEMNYSEKIIIALDFSSLDETKNFLSKLDFSDKNQSPSFFKVGMELFYAEGERIINLLKEKNLKIFLDLKLHDIPNTVAKSLKILCNKYSPEIINVHALGGMEMMRKAKEAVLESSSKTKLIAVTHLTSLDQRALREELNISLELEEAVLALAKCSEQAGLDGIVSSAHEAQLIKQNISQNFLTVCPGIRLVGDTNDDQKRVMKPADAINAGADYLVIGRAINQALDPMLKFQEIIS